ncbi:MAG: hypothetical protein RMK51_03610 [Meiothermus sp.]|uniref:hypothetical protein n=1 Tax=Meiothermus sp. TaxID=1955249 RepID=UPI00298EDB26|nr:hypothetical protein [Meiothermus sp.]MDW8424995.1 hypothetical protein [Meiothermus sp.]
MDEKERTIQILGQKLAQAEINHAYTAALLEAALEREKALQKRVEELEAKLEFNQAIS